MTHASLFCYLCRKSLVSSPPNRGFKRGFEGFALARRQKSANDPGFSSMSQFQFAGPAIRKLQPNLCKGVWQRRCARLLARPCMGQGNLFRGHAHPRFLPESANAAWKSKPYDQRIKTEKSDHGKRSHRHEGQTGNEAHRNNHQHDNGKGPRAKRPVRGQGGIKIDGFCLVSHRQKYRAEICARHKRGVVSQESDFQPRATALDSEHDRCTIKPQTRAAHFW